MLNKKALAATAAAQALYVEDVFSTYLWTGNNSTQTITNGIDLSGEGGLTITKIRDYTGESFGWYDTVRGANKLLQSAGTQAESTVTNYLNSFNSDGFTVGSNISVSPYKYASWTFRKAEKFFDVVTYTGNGSNRTIAHNLNSVPGCIIVKRTDTSADWQVYHRANTAAPETDYLVLNTTAATVDSDTRWNDTLPTSTVFSLGTDATVNANSGTYVAYLFAHDAGGFGDSGSDNVISCGSFTTDGSGNATVSLGYEPQWALIKPSNSTGDWVLVDTMRSWVVAGNNDALLYANTSDAEVTGNNFGNPTATGFTVGGLTFSNTTYIYIAIRRGPMKTPEAGTEVFSPALISGTGSSQTISSPGFAPDLVFGGNRSSNPLKSWVDKLRGRGRVLQSYDTSAEASSATNEDLTAFLNTGFSLAADWNTSFNRSGSSNNILWTLQRAPGFFDVVCYTGTGSATTVTHNLGVAPELMIVKTRSATGVNWSCYHSALGNTQVVSLNEDIQAYTSTQWNNTTPTSSVFSVGTQDNVNGSSKTYVAYLFATLSGVSKVGSYTGTGTTKQVDCGFTGGARFVLIKRTDESASGNHWYVWDTARGIVSGNDPYLLLNSTNAEVTNTDYIDTYSQGFEISSTAPASINANGGTFIFFAVA